MGEIPYLLNKNPVTCIKEERVWANAIGSLLPALLPIFI